MLPYRLRKTTMVYLILEGLSVAGGKVITTDFVPGGLGAAAARGWVNVVDGWAEITTLGRAMHEGNCERI